MSLRVTCITRVRLIVSGGDILLPPLFLRKEFSDDPSNLFRYVNVHRLFDPRIFKQHKHIKGKIRYLSGTLNFSVSCLTSNFDQDGNNRSIHLLKQRLGTTDENFFFTRMITINRTLQQ